MDCDVIQQELLENFAKDTNYGYGYGKKVVQEKYIEYVLE